jgi:predicted Zn finger-like uncharacterized protein
MIVSCTECNARYRFDEEKLGSRPAARTRCPKCGASIEIQNPLMLALTLPPEPEFYDAQAPPPEETTGKTQMSENVLADGTRHDTAGQDMFKSGALELTAGRRYSLAIIQGAATGQIYPIAKPRMIIGRQGCDIDLQDSEASRQHAAVEVLGDHAILRDLGSTNGTFVEQMRIDQNVLTNQAEFRIGSHVLMFIVTADDEVAQSSENADMGEAE